MRVVPMRDPPRGAAKPKGENEADPGIESPTSERVRPF